MFAAEAKTIVLRILGNGLSHSVFSSVSGYLRLGGVYGFPYEVVRHRCRTSRDVLLNFESTNDLAAPVFNNVRIFMIRNDISRPRGVLTCVHTRVSRTCVFASNVCGMYVSLAVNRDHTIAIYYIMHTRMIYKRVCLSAQRTLSSARPGGEFVCRKWVAKSDVVAGLPGRRPRRADTCRSLSVAQSDRREALDEKKVYPDRDERRFPENPLDPDKDNMIHILDYYRTRYRRF